MIVGKHRLNCYGEEIEALGAELRPSASGECVEAHCPPTVSRESLAKIGYMLGMCFNNGLGGDPEMRTEGNTLIIKVYPD